MLFLSRGFRNVGRLSTRGRIVIPAFDLASGGIVDFDDIYSPFDAENVLHNDSRENKIFKKSESDDCRKAKRKIVILHKYD